MATKSPSTRRAWIEIARPSIGMLSPYVALHPEGVDRNDILSRARLQLLRVALHPEGVDRNMKSNNIRPAQLESPSTRRAWIEIYSTR